MPDVTPDPRPDYGRAAERALTWASGIFLVAAVAAFATGDQVSTRGDSFRTHVDAVWVLGTLSMVSLVCAFFVSDAKVPHD